MEKYMRRIQGNKPPTPEEGGGGGKGLREGIDVKVETDNSSVEK